VRRHLWWVLGLVLVVGGALVVLLWQPEPADVGWFAYTPLEGTSSWNLGWGDAGGDSVVMTYRQLVGYAVVVVGLLVIAASLGFRWGQRRAGRL
jgi:hypothetical protein